MRACSLVALAGGKEKMCHVPDVPLAFAAYALYPKKKGRALVDGATTKTVVVVLGDDPLIARVLGLVLSGTGYKARVLDSEAVLDAPGEALAGVDVVLLMPRLGDEREGELVGAIEGGPATAAVPVLKLSTDSREGAEERAGSVPWPCPIGTIEGALGRAVLAPEPGGEVP